ncbi:hypothetical protein EDF56_11561 [Novosphingobium sp. PhB165]|uniref:lytic transglycosylase domain-containing protein n=1 Tax=Novosphingobium sp. PhB165 TaxID=2485105 RepID=UPI001047611A|nr:lytic transglycosylase domain-containing protein [Novosphingobium sp. PhB165]TCM14036.1 hypothetical protein EDF56_11561 [Novosphingobium sp. PhB165]
MNGNRGKCAFGALGLPLALFASGVEARPATNLEQEATIGRCIREAASGRQWLERTLWGLRDQEAGWIGAEVPNTNGSHDLGPMQINSWWLPKLSVLTGRSPETVRFWLIHDACFNVQVARWIFLSKLARIGGYWSAIGAYHSPTPIRARKYAEAVADKLKARDEGRK